jgi:hypothetical protein
MRINTKLVLALVTFSLAGCAYIPPVEIDRTEESYVFANEACPNLMQDYCSPGQSLDDCEVKLLDSRTLVEQAPLCWYETKREFLTVPEDAEALRLKEGRAEQKQQVHCEKAPNVELGSLQDWRRREALRIEQDAVYARGLPAAPLGHRSLGDGVGGYECSERGAVFFQAAAAEGCVAPAQIEKQSPGPYLEEEYFEYQATKLIAKDVRPTLRKCTYHVHSYKPGYHRADLGGGLIGQ